MKSFRFAFPAAQRTNLTGNRQALHRLRNDPTPNSEKNTIQTACFISDDTIALMLLDGKLEILNIATNHREPIPIKILGDAAYRHKARLLPIRNSVYLVSWVYGDNGITVIDWKSKRILWQVDGHVSCPIYQDGKLLYAAESVWKQREGLSEYEKNFAIGCSVLAMREIVTGNLVLEYECERFDSVVLDTKQSFLWALDGKTLYKFHIDLTTPQ